MAKAVAAKNTASGVAQQGARNYYQEFADEVKQSGIEGSLLRFTKTGDWIAGQEEEELELGTELIMGLNTLKRGWQKWSDNKPVDARMGLMSEGYRPPNRDELGDLDEEQWEYDETSKQSRDPWQKTIIVLLKDPATGDIYTYATSSKSGIAALGEASQIYGDRIQDGSDPEEMPVIRLQQSSYKHKTYGKIMIPVFEFTEQWVKPQDIEPTAKKGAAKLKARAQAASPKASPANGRVGPKSLPAPARKSTGGNRARI